MVNIAWKLARNAANQAPAWPPAAESAVSEGVMGTLQVVTLGGRVPRESGRRPMDPGESVDVGESGGQRDRFSVGGRK